MPMSWDEVAEYALMLPGVERVGSALKVNGHTLVAPSREPDSFALHIDKAVVDLLMETDPDTYWQTPHYAGWPWILVRYDTADPGRARDAISRARDWNAARPAPKPRKPRKWV